MSSSPSLSIQEAAGQLREQAQLLDVRTPAEFEGMHVPGSILAPLDELDPEALKSTIDPGAPLLIMCRSGKRASVACDKLRAVFPGARVVAGGIEAWAAAGQPVNRGRAVMSLERQVRIAAGTLVLIGSILAWKVSLGFIALPAFVGAGLAFAGLTDTCSMGMLLAKLPWNRRGGAQARAALTTG